MFLYYQCIDILDNHVPPILRQNGVTVRRPHTFGCMYVGCLWIHIYILYMHMSIQYVCQGLSVYVNSIIVIV